MDIYKLASRKQLRVSTTKGLLPVEQLWTLSLSSLSTIIRNVKKQLNGNEADSDLAFLDETKTVDTELQLTFDILKDIYQTKKTELDEERRAVEVKAQKEKLMSLLAKKQDEKFENMTEEQILAELSKY